jgi:hypothetical protein
MPVPGTRWKTANGGASWQHINRHVLNSDVFSVIVDATDSSVVYASACSGITRQSAGDLFHKLQGIPFRRAALAC